MKFYVYYKFVVSQKPTARADVKKMQEQLAAEFDLRNFELMKRPEKDVEGRETWMEVYACADDSCDAFAKRLQHLSLLADLPQPRRTEIFVEV
jgi:hypothetical protein